VGTHGCPLLAPQVAHPHDFDDCVESLLKDFKIYDRTVDIVSCWQFLFTEVAPFSNGILHFDRFPRLRALPSPAGDSPKTPDFAALLTDSYGLVADVKEGFPRNDAEFLSHGARLLKYDCPLNFRAGPGANTVTPRIHDILLLIPLRDAQEIVTRLEKLRAEGKMKSDRNLVIMEWFWDVDRDEYVFRKVAGHPVDFSDGHLPSDLRLSRIFTERGASLKISPEKIKIIKATWQFCNDTPPPIYTVVFLWTKILYHLLDQEQRQVWRRRDPRKTLGIDTTTARLVEEIEVRYPIRWGHWTDWVRSALDTLVDAGLARRTQTDRYVVGYRNLAREVGDPSAVDPGNEGKSLPREYARILATYICRGADLASPSEGTGPEPGPQGYLFR